MQGREGQWDASVSRRNFLKLGLGVLGGGAAALAAGAFYGTSLEPGWIEVVRRDIVLPRLPGEWDGLTIGLLSDLHVGAVVPPSHVAKAVALMNALKPDLVALVGDFVTGAGGYAIACSRELAALEAPMGVFGVLGNHDVWTDPRLIVDMLTRNGVQVLRDQVIYLQRGEARLALVGVEDAGHSGSPGVSPEVLAQRWRGKLSTARGLLRSVHGSGATLLLVHNPDVNEFLEEDPVDLALCGHTHGGQVVLPGIGPPLLPSSFGKKYAGGLVQAPSSPVYVTRGIGMTRPAVRLNCRPEVTLLSLRAG
ncbi:MAG: metallophosphoesterase [Anaerolineae bacterium]